MRNVFDQERGGQEAWRAISLEIRFFFILYSIELYPYIHLSGRIEVALRGTTDNRTNHTLNYIIISIYLHRRKKGDKRSTPYLERRKLVLTIAQLRMRPVFLNGSS